MNEVEGAHGLPEGTLDDLRAYLHGTKKITIEYNEKNYTFYVKKLSWMSMTKVYSESADKDDNVDAMIFMKSMLREAIKQGPPGWDTEKSLGQIPADFGSRLQTEVAMYAFGKDFTAGAGMDMEEVRKKLSAGSPEAKSVTQLSTETSSSTSS